MRIRSFKSQLLLTIVTGYVVLWTIFCTVVVFNFREDTARLFHTQQEWLTLYTRTFLDDLKQGNSLAVEQKLKTLVNKKIFSEARLSYGAREILVQGPKQAPSSSSWALTWMLPETKVITPVRDNALSEWGVLEASLSPEYLLEPIRQNIVSFIQQTGALFFFLLAGLLWMVDRQTKPLLNLSLYIRRFATRKNNSEAITSMLNEDIKLGFSELEVLLSEFQSTIRSLLALQEEIRRQRMQSEASKLAAQVAHDIRSPLSALSLATSDLRAVPEEKRVLIRAAVNRINDIANELLERYRSLDNQARDVNESAASSEVALELLPTLVDGVISEKRSQYQDRAQLSFDLHVNEACYGMFAKVNAVQFTRIISNLVNNAVDAIETTGHVHVHFESQKNQVIVRVEDTGKGIAPELIPGLFQRGSSHGKKTGMGLGLYHARTFIEGWNGTIQMRCGGGKTSVEIRLPSQTPPDWFLPRIELSHHSTIVILDDDVAIHLVWQQRLQSLSKKYDLTVLHFSQDKELFEWHANNPEPGDITYLIDYELIGSGNTGIEIVKRLGIQSQSALVTSHYEDKRIRAAAKEIGTPFIPKMMAPFVPLNLKQPKPERPTEATATTTPTILLDDEDLVHMTWKMAAKTHGKSLHTYKDPESLFAALETEDPKSPVYIDRNLANGVLGETIAERLFERGFKNLYLATGMDKADLPPLPFIKGVQSKSPPWGPQHAAT